MIRLSIILFSLLFISTNAFSQKQAELKSSKSSFQVLGTSTLHDWSLSGNEASSKAEIEMDGDEVTNINSLKIKLTAESLTSDQDKSEMTKKAHKALKVEDHPTIYYTLDEIKSSKSDHLVAVGRLQIADTTRKVETKVDYTKDDNVLVFKTDTKVKLSDFNLDRPSALMGTIKVDDEIQLKVELVYELK
ncbi:MAG: YceI family protein [Cyclobacteriaceae bacterium]|nr:YceI family protein [Cyclobacteriaceae bacterium]MCH8516195.1 YceI family protein [Cyclobacteriaceae bacterium]